MTWRAIDTAPHGQSVLIHTADGQQHVAWFHEAQGGWNTFFADAPLDPQWLEEYPTHWMPLADPPDDLRDAIDALNKTIDTLPEAGK